VTIQPPSPASAPIVDIQLSRSQFWAVLWAILCTIAGGYIGLIYMMVSVVYGGINDRINRLEDHFQIAIAADVEIKDLLKNAPHLIQDVNEIKESLKNIPKQVQALQQSVDKLQIQTTNIQKQVHEISSVPQ
jgi:peptidoglycan hydrolase CwlO-like protein